MDRSTALSSLLVVLLSTQFAAAAPPATTSSPAAEDARSYPAFEEGRNRWLARIEELNLTPEQRAAMKAIGERYRTLGHPLAERARQIREEFMAVAPDSAGYAAATDAAVASTATLASDTVRLLSDLRAELYGLLTDEQRQQLTSKATEERQRWDDWRSRHKPAQ